MPCSLTDVYQCFGGTCGLHLHVCPCWRRGVAGSCEVVSIDRTRCHYHRRKTQCSTDQCQDFRPALQSYVGNYVVFSVNSVSSVATLSHTKPVPSRISRDICSAWYATMIESWELVLNYVCRGKVQYFTQLVLTNAGIRENKKRGLEAQKFGVWLRVAVLIFRRHKWMR